MRYIDVCQSKDAVFLPGRMRTVTPIALGAVAPALPAPAPADGPSAVFFYKVTCPVCQLAAPKVRAFGEAYPGHVVAVGQDPADTLAVFEREYAFDLPTISDGRPYELSDAFGIEVVPTLFVLDAGRTVVDVVESWDREGLNRASATLAGLLDLTPRTISDPDDGLPSFRPG
jgi:thiol-disulfide isomerase/thioredoxin